MVHRVKIAAAFVLFSCGGPATPESHPLPVPATTASVQAKRKPSDALARHVAERAKVFAYADLEGLFATQLGRGLAPILVKLAGNDLAPCIESLIAGGKEVLYSSGSADPIVAVRFDPAKMSPSACRLTVAEPGVGIFGDTSDHANPIPAALTLDADEYAHAHFIDAPDGPEVAHVALVTTGELFALHAFAAHLPEERARMIASTFEQKRTTFPSMMKDASADERDAVARLLHFATLRQNKGRLDFAVDLHETPPEQARDVGTIAALMVAGVHKYLLESKEAEARNTVPAIARSIAAWWEREELSPSLKTPLVKKKLQSFPAIPPTVPRGTKYQPSEKEWATWSVIKFEMDQPIYYQYEVRAAKDGESAEVIARGDLNGDGKTSSFVITIKVKKDKDRTLEISPIVETDPDE